MSAWATAERIEFSGERAQATHRQRCAWIRDAIELRESVVPVCPSFLHFPIRQAGFTTRTVTYDLSALASAYKAFHREHMPDSVSMEPLMPGRVFDILGCRQWEWPGHGLPDDAAFQWVEDEYMRDDEYELLIADPDALLAHPVPAARVSRPRAAGGLRRRDGHRLGLRPSRLRGVRI